MGLTPKQQEALAEIKRRADTRMLFQRYAKIWAKGDTIGTGVYPWQVEVHNAGKDNIERAIFAGNRVGKTSCAAAELACHLTGEYPTWWDGHRFKDAIKAWCGGETNETVRDVIQTQLLGPVGSFGTGWIPGDRLYEKIKYRQAGISDVVDMVHVRHKAGNWSSLGFKTYEQEVKKWRGAALDYVWLDEEPGMQIYTEAVTRILSRKGRLLITFTPHEGFTEVVRHFTEAQPGTKIYMKNVSWDDAPHLDMAERERLWATYPIHERQTRARGTPMLGTGAIFPLDEKDITVDPFKIPDWWPRINGIDFGISTTHPFAAAFCAYDRDGDTFYVYDCHRTIGETPIYHVAALKKHGESVPTAWPRDGLARDKGSGEVLRDQYRKHGAYMLPEFALYPDERGVHVEPGLIEMYEYMKSGRFKVFSTCRDWFEEFRSYHRDDKGQIVKTRDDALDASRYAFMMRRYAKNLLRTSAGHKAPVTPFVGRRA